MTQKYFEKGQSVAWDPQRHPLTLGQRIKGYGSGPFTIVKVEEVPLAYRTQVGHRQWITVKTTHGSEEKFSGSFFIPAPSPPP